MSSILIVDDQSIIREPVAVALQSHGYLTHIASNGQQALKIATEHLPDLVLLDISLSGTEGFNFLRALRSCSQLRHIPVIILTAAVDRQCVLEVARLGVSGYLVKSRFSLDDLLLRIRTVLESSKRAMTESTVPLDPKQAVPTSPALTVETTVAAELLPAANVPPAGSLQELKPLLVRSQMQEMLDHCGELKAMSPTVTQILKLTQSRDCSIEHVAKAIKQDQAIALKVLKIANSPVYARGQPIDTVQKAVMRIGLNQVRQMVLNLNVMERFNGSHVPSRIDPLQFWEHSIATGIIAAQIARSLHGGDEAVDAAFTMGLLHDVGRLVYLEMLGDTYLRVLDEAERLRLPLEQVESRLLLINHSEAMDRILHGWSFPKHLINPIAFHHLSVENIRRMSPRSMKEVSTLALADRYSHALLLGDSGNPVIYSTHEYSQAVNLPVGVVNQFVDQIPDQTTDLKLVMLSNTQGGIAPEALLLKARRRLEQPLRPIFISQHADTDALRLLCERLSDHSPDQPPNIAIIHLTQSRERPPLAIQLKDAESQAGVTALPLMMLSATGELVLEAGVLAGRRTATLSCPFYLHTFLDAINALCPSMARAAR